MVRINFSDGGSIDATMQALVAALMSIASSFPGIVDAACKNGIAATKPHLPVDTGKLEVSGISQPVLYDRVSARGGMSWPVRYASIMDEGSRPHMIRPKMGKGVTGPVRPSQTRRKGGKALRFLRWEGADGRPVFAREVLHPGTKAMNFTRHARNIAISRIIIGLELSFVHANDILKRQKAGG